MENQKRVTMVHINSRAVSPHTLTIEKVGVKAGMLICASLIAYFLLMQRFNFMDSPVAWLFNVIILGAGIVLTYRYYRSRTTLNIDYMRGLILGCLATAACVIPYALFIYFFFSTREPALLALLKDNALFMGEPINPLRAAAATLVEGISSGLIISFMMMQYFKSGFGRVQGEERMQG